MRLTRTVSVVLSLSFSALFFTPCAVADTSSTDENPAVQFVKKEGRRYIQLAEADRACWITGHEKRRQL